MSGMENFAKALGYDDSYVASKDSRDLYHVMFTIDAMLGKWVRLDGAAVSVSAPFNPLMAGIVDETTLCIATAMRRSATAVKRQRELGRQLLGMQNKKPGAV